MVDHVSKQRAKCLRLIINSCFLILICLTLHLFSSNSDFHFPTHFKTPNSINNLYQKLDRDIGCRGIPKLQDHHTKCSYVKAQGGCQLGGYISYLQLYYCNFTPLLGYTVLLLWLLLLFYLLGDTAANYFCSSLGGLSKILNLSPTVAGVTLLSLGNGAPDMCASLAAFTAEGTNEVGLSNILGSTFFVTSAVVGIISIINRHGTVSIDKTSFLRNIVFYLFSLICLLLIVVFGKINFWGALLYLSVYVFYVLLVSYSEFCNKDKKSARKVELDPEGGSDSGTPLLGFLIDDTEISISSNQDEKWSNTQKAKSPVRGCFEKFVYILELPLYLPRRLTIPVVSEDRWSKPYAVVSITIAPLLLTVIWSSDSGSPDLMPCMIGLLVGVVLGIAALVTTDSTSPPRKCLVAWYAVGFLMSITWTYIVAEELVSLLVSLGLILGISPSILGLTVLSWGTSLGDLVADVTLATGNDIDEFQIAMSGCFAGPIFNTVASLGLSLCLASWKVYPNSYEMPTDSSVYVTMGFLVGGLLWSLAILPNSKMRLGRLQGIGLLAIYFCFLSLKLAGTLGLLPLDAPFPQNT
ncbi:hypothetical protein NMG60_11033517 [Bertholletia excelsa]